MFVVNEQGGRGWAPDPPNPPSDGREPYQSTYFFVMEIALLSYLSIFCTSSVIFFSYTDYNLKQNYTHYNVNSKIRSFSTDLSFLSLRIDKKITIHQIFLLAHNWSQGITRLNNPPSLSQIGWYWMNRMISENIRND